MDLERKAGRLYTSLSGMQFLILPISYYIYQVLTSNKDPEAGGIADRPGDMVDVFHTVFGLAGLSLVKFPGLEEVDPV